MKRNYRYFAGDDTTRETVDFDLYKGSQDETTCVVDVPTLMKGRRVFPCGNGDDHMLTNYQEAEIYRLVRAKRNELVFPKFIGFLRDLAPYVVVVGTYARNEANLDSGIQCYLRCRPRAEVDPEAAVNNGTYMPEVLELIDQYGLESSSIVGGYIAVNCQEGIPRMVEISSHHRIPYNESVFEQEIFGVPFLCARDDRTVSASECYEYMEWDDAVSDVVIKNPLPKYAEA